MGIRKKVKSKKTSKKAPKAKAEKIDAGFYKGYAIDWLRKEPEHPDYGLVAEYDSKRKK